MKISIPKLASEIPQGDRIVAVQGTAQLASALAVGRVSWNKEPPRRNHLLIHDLCSKEGQDRDFARCIGQLAERSETWSSIIYVAPKERSRLDAMYRRDPRVAGRALSEILSPPHCCNLVLSQCDLPFQQLLRTTFPNATHTCYGDAVGINYSERYLHPGKYHSESHPLPFLRRAAQAFKRKRQTAWRRLRFGRHANPRDFDHYCLLLENLFDQCVDLETRIPANEFIDLFDQFAESMEENASDIHHKLIDLVGSGRTVVILLTSNMSEAARISESDEINGYLNQLKQLPRGKSVSLVIKPHPRDSLEKLHHLHDRLTNEYADRLVLSDPWTFYLPFESLFARYFSSAAATPGRVHTATVSSACLSLEYLYGQRCLRGFGNDIVMNGFHHQWKRLRLAHESDLSEIITSVRKIRSERSSEIVSPNRIASAVAIDVIRRGPPVRPRTAEATISPAA